MNPADLARLELAKRAYKAAQPSESEIQTGVRRARLSLARPRPRRAWFSKGLVFVALAIGSLAYAKPHALGELVENVLPQTDANGKKVRVGAAAFSLPPETPNRVSDATVAGANDALGANAANPASSGSANDPHATAAVVSAPDSAAATPTTASKSSKRPRRPTAAAAAPTEAPAPDTAAAVSDWGRVGQALARGDETQALATLGELSENADQRTRDKADVGRAQLLMAHGDRDNACALARALTNRRAGSRIERQAQALLKSCTR